MIKVSRNIGANAAAVHGSPNWATGVSQIGEATGQSVAPLQTRITRRMTNDLIALGYSEVEIYSLVDDLKKF